MQEVIQSSQIIEKRAPQYLSYVFLNEDLFSYTGCKLLENHQESGLIPSTQVMFNGLIKLVYHIDSYTSLQMRLAKLKPEEFLKILKELYETTDRITNTGFIQVNHIVYTPDKIFLDVEDHVKLIYIPTNIMAEQDSILAYEESIKQMIQEIIASNNNLKTAELSRLYSDLYKEKISMHTMICNIDDGRYDKGYGDCNKENMENKVKLVGINIGSPFEIIIGQNDMVLGKNKVLSDIVIPNNQAISRVHCKIVYSEHNYYISDLGSANGTYINGIKLNDYKLYPINIGDEIRLANYRFILVKASS